MASTQERSFTVVLSRLGIPTRCRLLSFSKIAIGLPFSCLEEEQGLQFALLRGVSHDRYGISYQPLTHGAARTHH